MKIKVKIVGKSFPDDIRGTVQEVEIASIVDSGGSFWTIGNTFHNFEGYELEPVEEASEDKPSKKGDKSIDFGDNELKTLTVEFK